MKQHRNRQRSSRNRNSTPSVICLPAAKPPVTAKRSASGSGPALSLPQTAEPLTFESRQVRRQNRRVQGKAGARGTSFPAITPVHDPVPAACEPVEPHDAAEAIAPLPRNRTLAPTRKGIVAKLLAWLRKPVRKQPEPTVAGQLQMLRNEVAGIQRSLDRALEQLTA